MNDTDKKISLIKRNAKEIVTEDELRELIRGNSSPTTYVGYEPSGTLHLGHLLTANKLIDLQKAGFNVKILLADLHAYLNEKGSIKDIRETAEMNKDFFLAYGLEEDKTEFVLGSEYQLDEDYIMDVYELSLNVTLNRARRSMDEVSRRKKNPIVGQMLYPLMQAADIGFLGIDLAVGGIDQRKIHMLAREILPKIDYNPPICLHTPILTGLDGKKMSSSRENWIDLSDSPEEIEEKINDAYCPKEQIKDNPVIEIMKYHIMPRYDEITIERPEKYGGDLNYSSFHGLKQDYLEGELHPLDLKKSVTIYLNEVIEPARKKVGGL
ncbi:MAG: Tyrosyl-tRNA synthetase [Candidatus Methanohalarchaeum thermophilum]|uniref:Tyrosine--tRNA ligase n=1 Tax=Methanohalarchaeum thermophilum TaxID=1903181 RepID=A0A1Q6DUD4_METT1|nr:MAG: Tyrosyl-tRNA synthetase [Candidatus Methanohalarchaeum thermophilum]